MTTSPRKTYRLTRDKLNNPLWTGRRRSAEEDEQNVRLAKFRKSFSGGLGGEAAMKELAELEKGATGDSTSDAAEAIYKMLESDEAYVPTQGKERGAEGGQTAGKKNKGVRT
jgi:hypothetical protein